MNKLIVTLTTTILFTAIGLSATEWKKSKLTVPNITSICFLDDRIHGWITANGGTIYRTSDAGEKWKKNQLDIYFLSSAHFYNTNSGCAVGPGNTIYYTQDGGKTWTKGENTSEGTFTLNKVFCLTNRNFIAAGDEGAVIKSSNGGETWSKISTNVQTNFSNMFFYKSNGWIVGTKGTIIFSSNTGSSWTKQRINTEEDVTSVYFVNETRGYVVGTNGLFALTSNNGSSWSTRTILDGENLISVYFIDDNKGWVVSKNGSIAFTPNAGKTWKKEDIGTNNALKCDYLTQSTKWLCGENGSILYSNPLQIILSSVKNSFSARNKDIIEFIPEITADNPIASWTLNINNEGNETINSINGKKTPEAIEWDGKDKSGEIVEVGNYKAVFTVEDNLGNAETSEDISVTVDPGKELFFSMAPTIITSPSQGKYEPLSFYMEIPKVFQKKKLFITDINNTTVRDLSSSIRAKFNWDIKDNTRKFTPAGIYYVNFSATDPKTKKELTEKKMIIIDLPQKEEKVLTVNLGVLLYKQGEKDLNSDHTKILENAIKIIKKYPEYSVEIKGYAEKDEKSTIELSAERAINVAKYIETNGKISLKILATVAYGDTKNEKTKLISSGENRKVEIFIVGTPSK